MGRTNVGCRCRWEDCHLHISRLLFRRRRACLPSSPPPSAPRRAIEIIQEPVLLRCAPSGDPIQAPRPRQRVGLSPASRSLAVPTFVTVRSVAGRNQHESTWSWTSTYSPRTSPRAILEKVKPRPGDPSLLRTTSYVFAIFLTRTDVPLFHTQQGRLCAS